MADTQDNTKHRHPVDGDDQTAAVGVAAAAGRDQYVGAQIGAAEKVARTQVPIQYNADLYRAVDEVWTST